MSAQSQQNMQISSVSLIQTEHPAGIGDISQRIIAVKVVAAGQIDPFKVSSLKFSMTGTTNIKDVKNIKIYYSGNNRIFLHHTAKLFASVKPAAGNISAKGSQILSAGDNYFWITYDISNKAKEGNFLDATCSSITADGSEYFPESDSIAGNRVLLLTNTLLFSPGDAGSVSYRIPALITAADGSLVTATDKRWASPADLPAKIDPVIRRSTDMGKTWSEPLTIANYGAPRGAGDPALVLDSTTGDLLCLVSSEQGFWTSTNKKPAKILVIRSRDNGITWGEPLDISSQIYGPNPNWKGLFVASGRAHQLRDGKIIAAIAVREDIEGKEHICNYIISSTDHGQTWTPSSSMAELDGDEAKIVELNSGEIMISVRNAGMRRFNVSKDQGKSWGNAYNQNSIIEPGCNGDFIRYTSTLDGYDKNRLLHSVPFSSKRNNVSVQLSTDEGKTWGAPKTIFPGASAYSSLTILLDGTIGMYYENGENSIYQMYFVRFSLNWLTGGADVFTPLKLKTLNKISKKDLK